MKRLIALVSAGSAAAALAVPSLAATTSVSLKDDFFSPSSKTVSKGTTVKFVWRGRSSHNVSVISGPSKFRSSLKTRGSYSKRLTRAGLYKITCTVHSGMDMRIRVR